LKKAGIYIHIPFCRRKCNYCDFYLITNTSILDRFLNNLKNEIEIFSSEYKIYSFDSVFIGGGTPSILSAKQIERILNALFKNYNISADSEITIETNPEDFIIVPNKLKSFKSVGINRISFGVQSFNNDELIFLTRKHTSEHAIEVIKEAKKYFDNISIDLIYSLPGQNLIQLVKTIDMAIKLDIPHISAYTLIYENETPIFNMLGKMKIKMNNDEFESELYKIFSYKLIKSGYEHYEVSNYAKKGFESKHNLKYWEYNNYLGFGPSAHSFFNGKRWNNFRNIIRYNINLQKNETAIENEHILTDEEKKTEYIMLGLRSKGVNLKRHYEIFGKEFNNEFANSINELTENQFGFFTNEYFKLTEKGYLFVDEICAKYF
jgi:oxygen-independent coproporphyrinogen III oxidase